MSPSSRPYWSVLVDLGLFFPPFQATVTYHGAQVPRPLPYHTHNVRRAALCHSGASVCACDECFVPKQVRV